MNLKKLIYCVHSQPALWDQKDDNYNNKVLLKQIWEEIAYDMSSSAEICRQKWRSLRDVFRRELKKYQCRLMDPRIQDKNLPRWYYFKELHFLTDQMLQTNSSIPEPLPESSGEEVFESFYVKDEPVDEELIFENSSDKLFGTYDNNGEQVNPIEVDEKLVDDRTEANVKFIKDNVRESLKRNLNYQFSFPEEKKKAKLTDRNKEDNSDYHFLMSLLPFMQAIPQNRKMIVRTKIQNIICQETIDDKNEKSGAPQTYSYNLN